MRDTARAFAAGGEDFARIVDFLRDISVLTDFLALAFPVFLALERVETFATLFAAFVRSVFTGARTAVLTFALRPTAAFADLAREAGDFDFADAALDLPTAVAAGLLVLVFVFALDGIRRALQFRPTWRWA
ncbi:MAG: hypothetical protein N2444_01375 [Methylocystis sp.]|nr:hypothetical protein [Methylocystis sp.]